MLSVLILSQLGYVAALSGVIMAVCVLKGYEMLGGKLTKKAVVISAVIMILMTYFADRVDWAIILFNQGGGAEAGYSLFECYRLILRHFPQKLLIWELHRQSGSTVSVCGARSNSYRYRKNEREKRRRYYRKIKLSSLLSADNVVQ